MVTFKLTQDQAKSWFPETYHSFITELRSSKSLSKDTLEENMNWFLNWGFFVKNQIQRKKNIISKRITSERWNWFMKIG